MKIPMKILSFLKWNQTNISIISDKYFITATSLIDKGVLFKSSLQIFLEHSGRGMRNFLKEFLYYNGFHIGKFTSPLLCFFSLFLLVSISAYILASNICIFWYTLRLYIIYANIIYLCVRKAILFILYYTVRINALYCAVYFKLFCT